MLTIEHSKYPQSQELRNMRAIIASQDTIFPPPYIMAAIRLQYAMDVGAKLGLANNGVLIKWPEGAESTGVFECLMYSENEDNYIVDLIIKVL